MGGPKAVGRTRVRFLVVLLGLLAAQAVAAMGFSEDPQEKLTKTVSLGPLKSLEIRGQVEFELVPGPEGWVTIETSRALFDQFTVSNWWGYATIAIESGLRGPRERGNVKIKITLPSLESLDVTDQSSGTITWPGTQGKIRVAENSSAILNLQGDDFEVDTSWKTQVSIRGHVTRLKVDLRHQSVINSQGLTAEDVEVNLDENSSFESGQVTRGTGLARHQSRVVVDDPEVWKDLRLREDSEKRSRAVPETPVQ